MTKSNVFTKRTNLDRFQQYEIYLIGPNWTISDDHLTNWIISLFTELDSFKEKCPFHINLTQLELFKKMWKSPFLYQIELDRLQLVLNSLFSSIERNLTFNQFEEIDFFFEIVQNWSFWKTCGNSLYFFTIDRNGQFPREWRHGFVLINWTELIRFQQIDNAHFCINRTEMDIYQEFVEINFFFNNVTKWDRFE